jgi:hypothetical protein
MQLTEIHVYPVKGARGIALARSAILVGGLRHDRRFMLVDEHGKFLSQREHPRLALLTTAIAGDGLELGANDDRVTVPLRPEGGTQRSVRIWHDAVDAIEVPGEASSLVASFLGARCTLVFMPDHVVRAVDPRYARDGDRVGFADGYPVLLAAQSSLDELNTRLATPVPMNRFRPNLVVAGGAAFDEDRHARAQVGPLGFRMPKRCERCQVTTVDQATAAVGTEPLRTLAQYRRTGNSVYFAQNLIPDGEGEVAVGDAVTYLD